MRALSLSLSLLLAAPVCAQSSRVLSDDAWCDDVWSSESKTVVCEVRETLLRTDALDVRATNGEVSVREWDRPDVLVRARVAAVGTDDALSRRLVRAARVTTAGGRVRDDTPSEDRRSATVSYEVFAPRRTALALAALNGPVKIDGMTGRIRATVTNGPVALATVGGDVEIDATNGPVSVDLVGPTWRGAGLTVRAMNGPIQVTVPERYSARLSARTDQGRISAPGRRTSAGERRLAGTGDRLDTTLGRGGPVLSLVARNGPVQIRTGG